MNLFKNSILIFIFCCLFSGMLHAGELDKIKKRLLKKADLTKIESLRKTKFNGLYEVVANGSVYYVDKDVKFLLSGDLIDIKERTNLTEVVRSKRKAEKIVEKAKRNKVNLASVGKRINDSKASISAVEERDSRGLLKIQGSSGCKSRVAALEDEFSTIKNSITGPALQPLIDNNQLRKKQNSSLSAARDISKANTSSIDKIQLMSTFIKSRPTDSMIVFPAKGEKKRSITALVDVDCPHCQRLFSDVEKYTNNGVEVRFMAFPLRGYGSEGERKLKAVWCADDRNQALINAFNKQDPGVAPNTCGFSIRQHIKFGRDLKLRSTPLIITSSGNIIHGYASSNDIEKVMNRTDELLAAAAK